MSPIPSTPRQGTPPGQGKRFPFPGEKTGPSRVDILELAVLKMASAESITELFRAMVEIHRLADEIRRRA